MPILHEFDTQSVRPWYEPRLDTWATLNFLCPFVAPPRLPHGIRQLDIGCNANICVRSALQRITESRADCHITTWVGTTLYSGIDHAIAFAPCDLESLTGEHWQQSSAIWHASCDVCTNCGLSHWRTCQTVPTFRTDHHRSQQFIQHMTDMQYSFKLTER